MKLAWIGCGNMAKAMIGGMLAGGADASEIVASAPSDKTRRTAEEQCGIRTTPDNKEAAKDADAVILAIKPAVVPGVCGEIRSVLAPDALVISIAAGVSLDDLKTYLGDDRHLVRAMPNTPAMVREGMTGYCFTPNVTEEDKALAARILSALGEAEEIPEGLMPAVTGVSGSAPAFIFILLEAMADAAVAEGMPRQMAYRFAAQTVKGSAALMQESGLHPGELKDMVCSPAGTTIAGVDALEKAGFRSAVIGAVRAAVQKGRK